MELKKDKADKLQADVEDLNNRLNEAFRQVQGAYEVANKNKEDIEKLLYEMANENKEDIERGTHIHGEMKPVKKSWVERLIGFDI